MLLNWLKDNYIELLGVIISLIYLYFSIKQNILLWLFGIISTLLYIYIFFDAKLYAEMSLQSYYLFISFYGWIYWLRNKNTTSKKELLITRTNKKTWLILSLITLLLFFTIAYILDNFTDSQVPYYDAILAAASIAATWMLARKLLEHWLIWIVIDAFSTLLYVYKNLDLTAFLFVVYTIMAAVGFLTWKKEFNKVKS